MPTGEPEQQDTREQALAKARRIYTETVIDHAINPRHFGNMQNADGFARVTGPCGDTMEIWLRVRDDTITGISFMTDGCGTSIASGSMVTELAQGTSISQAVQLSQEDVLGALGGMPEESRHCALLAASTLKAAVRDYLMIQKEPWKKAYRQH